MLNLALLGATDRVAAATKFFGLRSQHSICKVLTAVHFRHFASPNILGKYEAALLGCDKMARRLPPSGFLEAVPPY